MGDCVRCYIAIRICEAVSLEQREIKLVGLYVGSLDSDECGLVGFTVVYWKDLSSSPPGRTLQAILKAVLNSNSESALVKEATKILLEPLEKRIGEDIWKMETINMSRTKYEIRTDDTKGDYSRPPIEIWDRRG